VLDEVHVYELESAAVPPDSAELITNPGFEALTGAGAGRLDLDWVAGPRPVILERASWQRVHRRHR